MVTSPVGVSKVTAIRPGVPCGETNSKSMTDEVLSAGRPSQSRTRAGVAGDLQGLDGDLGLRVVGGVRHAVLPLDEVGQLRVGLQALDAQLLPAQLDPVGAVPVALDGLAAEACS